MAVHSPRRLSIARLESESPMTRHPEDQEPEPPGGRAAERLRMFLESRQPAEAAASPKKSVARKPRKKARTRKRSGKR